MNLGKLEAVTEKAFAIYLKSEEISRKSATKKSPIGCWKLLFKAGHRAKRYLELRRKIEEMGGQFRDRPPLKKGGE